MDQHEIRRLEEARERKKWISRIKFNSIPSKPTVQSISNYVNLEVSQSPKLYDFRAIDKKKWVNKTNFNVL